LRVFKNMKRTVEATLDAESATQPTDLTKFFAPSSAALVGATNDLSKFGGRCFEGAIAFGFSGQIYPVNPRADHVLGRRCYPSVLDLPEAPDHVGIAVPANRVMDVLGECAARNVPFVTVYTAGFGETGTQLGVALQKEMLSFARHHRIRFMGPNCNGILSYATGFALSPTASTLATMGVGQRPGRIGIVAQSGGLGQVSVMFRAIEIGLGISHEVSCGNQADLDVVDFADHMVTDSHTDVILMAVESIPDGEKLRRVAARATAAEKPIVMLKFGRTEAGRKQSASHTGAVTGSGAVYSAAFRQFGIIEVEDCNELYQMAMLLQQRRWPKSPRAATLAVSGGHTVLLADLGSTHGIEWPEYSVDTQVKLHRLIPDFGRVDNPTDLTAAAIGSTEVFSEALQSIAADPAVDILLPIYSIHTRADLEAAAAFVRESTKAAALLWTGGCSNDRMMTPKVLVESGVPVFREATACLKAARAAADFGAFVERAKRTDTVTRPSGCNSFAARAILSAASGSSLTEREGRQLLATYGFPGLRETLATSAMAAVAAAQDIGASVALKLESPDIVHKTEAGGVRVGLAHADEVAQAYEAIVASARRYAPEARINGVVVQEMSPPGVELILGITQDPTFGPVLSVGLGGIHVEVLRDITHRLAPIGLADAQAMLRELRGFPLLTGVRGMPARDIGAIAELLVRLSWLASDLREEILELDVNPLLVREQGAGAHVLDTLIVRQPRSPAA
jgi:acetyltransferase